jgi:hypothetical protein
MAKYRIRFNYRFIPFIWIRCPKFVFDWSTKTDMYVDGSCDARKRNKKGTVK